MSNLMIAKVDRRGKSCDGVHGGDAAVIITILRHPRHDSYRCIHDIVFIHGRVKV